MMSKTASLNNIRTKLRAATLGNEAETVKQLVGHLSTTVSPGQQQANVELAAEWVREIRAKHDPGLMESFLAEYGLSTQEGIALMCLAEAYLRVPDTETLDDLISDKLSLKNFAEHLGHSSSFMVNASTWGLMLTGSILSEPEERGLLPVLHNLVKRAGEPVIRTAVKQMMHLMGGQFVLGESIEDAIKHGEEYQSKAYRYSFDMLGEAALTQEDADRYYLAYADAITALANHCHGHSVRENPGISVKLSALFPRYETLQKSAVMSSLFPAIRSLCLLAKKAGMGLNIDAEESERLDLSLDIIEALLADGSLNHWEGLGVVVQAYGYRAPHVLDWLYALAEKYDTRLMVRLVKGAYWDREIKRSQELGVAGYPVYTRKNNTDLSYWYCAQKLLQQRDRIFPQFATHNAHTVAAIINMAPPQEKGQFDYEFQRLHGMGEALYEVVRENYAAPCRIYAPVGVHQDLLAYLVRRLLENGANASFVSQLLNHQIRPREITADPIQLAEQWLQQPGAGVVAPKELFQPERPNSKGWDEQEPQDLQVLLAAREPFAHSHWQAKPLLADAADDQPGKPADGIPPEPQLVYNPATGDAIGSVLMASRQQLDQAVTLAKQAQKDWEVMTATERGKRLNQAADLYEQHAGELFALLCREAGKTLRDAIAELREAVDFLRYYAAQAEHLPLNSRACGVMACISPWNFPLAIFTGQLSAALAAGNAVIVKPAESTTLVAYRAIELLHQAGISQAVCPYLPGDGQTIGAAMSQHPGIDGMIFTGSTATAKKIESAMSQHMAIHAPIIAETGGLNAMMVDSSALPEQVVKDIVVSAFQSAGQRCSALRILYVQQDIAERTLSMLYGAMEQLKLGNPWDTDTDIGPVINENAKAGINEYLQQNQARLLKQIDTPELTGHFIAPSVLRVESIKDLTHEVFGPVLHVATYAVQDLERVIDDINQAGYGLTFGLHTRIDTRVQDIVDRLQVGNMYVNRNQIGAIVGSQPFGGEGLSGTGPKAGGPYYLHRLCKSSSDPQSHANTVASGTQEQAGNETVKEVNTAGNLLEVAKTLSELPERALGQLKPMPNTLNLSQVATLRACRQSLNQQLNLPGPTGEDNLLSLHSRGLMIIATPDPEIAFKQAVQALYAANPVMVLNPHLSQEQRDWLASDHYAFYQAATIEPDILQHIPDLAGFAFTPQNELQEQLARHCRVVLSQRSGAIIRFITEALAPFMYIHERHLCVNTTAAGGNVALIAAAE